MAYRVRFTPGARDDLRELYGYLVERDLDAARRARDAIAKAADFLRDFPFACRKVDDRDPFLRESVIPFGASGYVALFEIEDDATVTVLAVRHQREDDYH